MARNHYSFEKRQRELAKKKKRQEKRQQKADARSGAEQLQPGDSAERQTATDLPTNALADEK